MPADDQAAACPNCGAPVVEGRCSSATCQNDNGPSAATPSLDELIDLLASTEDAMWRADVQAVLRRCGFVYRRGVWVRDE